MYWVNTEERLPIKSWCKNVEPEAMAQAKNLANLPFAFRHVALMPDCHVGYGMPIGGVMATRRAIVPNAVGVDIACGMIAVQTDCTRKIRSGTVKKVLGEVRQAIPVGFSHHDAPQEWSGFDEAPEIPIIQRELNSARKQIGTLGGGNHFLEIQYGSDGHVWLMVHSGSRNFGYKIAKTYHEKAKDLCRRYYSDMPHLDLSFLPIESPEAKEYFIAMEYAMRFAKESRKMMMDKFCEAVSKHLKADFQLLTFDIHHNYARWENHFGENVIVHRKGATSAKKGERGIIPGSQGSGSYIVIGLGNPESFNSCSHGAGRIMGRNQARRTLDIAQETKLMEKQNIVHSIRGNRDLDEAPGAYKDIDEVMESQKDLVKIEVKLRPLGVIKG